MYEKMKFFFGFLLFLLCCASLDAVQASSMTNDVKRKKQDIELRKIFKWRMKSAIGSVAPSQAQWDYICKLNQEIRDLRDEIQAMRLADKE